MHLRRASIPWKLGVFYLLSSLLIKLATTSAGDAPQRTRRPHLLKAWSTALINIDLNATLTMGRAARAVSPRRPARREPTTPGLHGDEDAHRRLVAGRGRVEQRSSFAAVISMRGLPAACSRGYSVQRDEADQSLRGRCGRSLRCRRRLRSGRRRRPGSRAHATADPSWHAR